MKSASTLKSLSRLAIIAAIVTASGAVALAKDAALNYLGNGQLTAAALLAPPPLKDSPEQAADMETVRQAVHAASSNDVAMAFSEKKFSIFTFTPAVGAFFIATNLPKTTAFFAHIQSDAAIITDTGKDFYQRPRPFVLDPSLGSGTLEKSFSYPSGHSTESMVIALVLADVLPEKRDAILAVARNIGWHRVQTGRHYPTDIYAGRVLANAIVQQLKKSESFQQDFAAVKAEIEAAQSVAKN